MIALRGARLVLADRMFEGGTLIVDGPRIGDILDRPMAAAHTRDLPSDAVIVPGFIDVHVHGVEGLDTLDEGWPIADIAARLPRYGVTAFCPTTVACAPEPLAGVLGRIDRARREVQAGARVLPAHLESNFISPEYRGAQPRDCLRLPPGASTAASKTGEHDASTTGGATFTGQDIVDVIDRVAGCTGIVTLAPELPGAIEFIRMLVGRGIRVSMGHSGASYDTALAGIDAGARHATHLFNRMSPLGHRSPGLVGAVLERDEVDAELICDGFHVHPAAARLALRQKSVNRIIAITDGTAGSGMPAGSIARLGGRSIRVAETAAFLDDGTLAGSTLTMDGAFRIAVGQFGCTIVEAARLCSTNPARALGLPDWGTLQPGSLADFVVLDGTLRVMETWIGGACAWSREGAVGL